MEKGFTINGYIKSVSEFCGKRLYIYSICYTSLGTLWEKVLHLFDILNQFRNFMDKGCAFIYSLYLSRSTFFSFFISLFSF
jgi:hypothetical protein